MLHWFHQQSSGGSRPSDKGGGGGCPGHPDPEITGGGGGRSNSFRPFGPQFGSLDPPLEKVMGQREYLRALAEIYEFH